MKTLELIFLTSEGKTVRLSIDAPKEPIDSVEVKAAMQSIIESGVFIDNEGFSYETSKEARLIERNITTIDID
jgi:hypothetical protein